MHNINFPTNKATYSPGSEIQVSKQRVLLIVDSISEFAGCKQECLNSIMVEKTSSFLLTRVINISHTTTKLKFVHGRLDRPLTRNV